MSTTPLPPFDEATLALLSDHLDGRLDAAAEAALRQRLADEPELAAELEALRGVGVALREDTARLPGAPDGFLSGVREAIARGDAPARDARPKMLRLLGAAYAAAALLIVGWTIGWYVDRGSDSGPVRATQSADVPPSETFTSEATTSKTTPSDTWNEGDIAAMRDETAAPLPTAAAPPAAPVAAPPPRPAASRAPTLVPGGAVDRGQREPSDEPAAGASTGDAPLGIGGGGGDAVPPRKLLVVRAKDVEAFVAWLSLVQADQPTNSAKDVGVVDARLARDEAHKQSSGATRVRLVLGVADWRRLFERLGLDVQAADAPRGETSLDVEVRASDR